MGGIRACAFATWPGRIPAGLVISDGAASKVELYNLAASQPQRVTQMRARLETFVKDAVPPGQEAGATEPPAPRAGAATTPR